MAAADVHARMLGRDERARDAGFLVGTEQAIRIDCTEGQSQHRRDGAERDVALAPCHAKAKGLAAFVHAAADHAHIGNGGGIGAGIRVGQRKAGDFFPACEARQVMVLLRFGAVVQKQLGGAQRVGHHDRHGCSGAARRQLHDDLRVRIRREALAAVFLRDDHAEEARALGISPRLGRQVLPDLRTFPIVGKVAKLFSFDVEEGLLFRRQTGRRGRQQTRPVRPAGEQFGIPPDRAGFNGVALRLRHLRHDLAEHRQHRARDECPAQRLDRKHQRGQHKDDGEHRCHHRADEAQPSTGDQPHRRCDQPGECRGFHAGESERADAKQDDPDRRHEGLHSMR